MAGEEKDSSPTGDEKSVVDELLEELGVDEEMRKKLVESGRATEDIMKVEPAEQVRRRLEMEKSIERVRDSLIQIERAISAVDEATDAIERNLVPVVLTFLVNLKGNLVSLRTTIVGRSKRKAKTNLQESYVKTVVAPIIEEEFTPIEETLTSGMATPILERVREIGSQLKDSIRLAMEELAAIKASLDDYIQKSSTELEFLTQELSMKPRFELPPDVQEKMRAMERRIEELTRDLRLTQQVLENREDEIEGLKAELSTSQTLVEAMESTIASLKAGPGPDSAMVAELRQQIKNIEVSRDMLKENLDATLKELEEAKAKTKEALAQLAKKDLECQDYSTKIEQLKQEMQRYKDRLGEIDEMKTQLREYQSGERVRELERIKSEYERLTAANERFQKEHAKMKAELDATKRRIESYMGLMESTEKTKAFLMLEETGQMTIREIGRSLGISPAQVTKWAEDFERLGIAKIDGDTLIIENGHHSEPEGTESPK
ncbi:MAG: hypothetical protein K9W43_06970 [Candidatus Thorarchaeota archaeon]|nr:hypothetical protein [Candidatus Thorarchaeota archaeon]